MAVSVCAGECLCECLSIWFLMLSNLLGCFFFGVSQFSNIHSIRKAEKKLCCVLFVVVVLRSMKTNKLIVIVIAKTNTTINNY